LFPGESVTQADRRPARRGGGRVLRRRPRHLFRSLPEQRSILCRREVLLLKQLLLYLFERPWLAGTILVLATIGLALPIPRLRIDASSESFMLEKDPARQFYEQAKQRFGSDTLTVIVVKAEDV